ncbi:hypothetical protein CK203_105550 [Vitis vinifera]|uniref:Myb-like domain-containing protein n=1 Tax=Vitis vinifera TaxID=29760 RepID=A0A438BQI2_VITVI|nr:hypothetical protein CK203_105550 [Vitis vinifera]
MPEVRLMGRHSVSASDLLHAAPYCLQTEVKSEPSVKKPPQHRCDIVQGTIKALLQPKIKERREKHHSQLAWLQQRCGESYEVEKQFKVSIFSSQLAIQWGGLPWFFFSTVIVFIYLFPCSIFHGSSFIGLISSISAGKSRMEISQRASGSETRPWTQEEDQKLNECMNKWTTECQTKNRPLSWIEIAGQTALARSSSSCRRDGNIWRISIEFAAWS